MSGTLYVVATPIGNLEDMTFRAVRVLREVSLIAAEDTRHTKKLLEHYGISTPLSSYHEHNEREKAGVLLGKLAESDIALVTDAGTPGISDPGYRLVKAAVEAGVAVVPIPGPSAIASIISVSGLPSDEFTFKGFLPARGAALRKALLGMKGEARTYVLYESPRRLKDTLGGVLETLGDIEAVVGRELTKAHEEIARGRVSSIMAAFEGREVLGEVTIVLRTAEEGPGDYRLELEGLLSSGMRLNDAVKAVASSAGLPKSEVYREALSIKERIEKKG